MYSHKPKILNFGTLFIIESQNKMLNYTSNQTYVESYPEDNKILMKELKEGLKINGETYHVHRLEDNVKMSNNLTGLT